jgi:hypothetical protein
LAAANVAAHTHGFNAGSGVSGVSGDTDIASSGAHSHDVEGSTASDSHNHGDGSLAAASDSHSHTDGTLATDSDNHSHDVTGATANALSATQSILPPYYSLAFIMRIS